MPKRNNGKTGIRDIIKTINIDVCINSKHCTSYTEQYIIKDSICRGTLWYHILNNMFVNACEQFAIF